MISNPSTLSQEDGESMVGKLNGKLHDNNNDEEEEDDHIQIDQINSLKKKLIDTGIVSSLKRGLSTQDDSVETKKIRQDELSTDTKRKALIRLKQLENKLRNEETKYIVLKRLYYSQKSNVQRAVNGQPKTHPSQKPAMINKTPVGKTMPNKPASSQVANRPPTTPIQNSTSATPLNKQQHLNRTNNNNSPLMKNPSPSPSSAFSPIAEPKKPNAQTHALVNQLVRKEFEKSLNQLEFPPKSGLLTPLQQQQIFQDIYFLPNANSPDFLMCLGLEEVVRCVQEHLNNKQQYKEQKEQKEKKELNLGDQEDKEKTTCTQIEIRYEYPYVCAQCSTDWTPVWRTDRNGVVLCEKCLKQIEKKHVKQEQMGKLKQLFGKAQKDKEVFEKQVLSEQSNVPKAASVSHSTPKQIGSAQSRPSHSTPVSSSQKFAPNSRPSPVQPQRPSPAMGAKTSNSAPVRANQPNQSMRNVPTMPAKAHASKEQQRHRQSSSGPNQNYGQSQSVKLNPSSSNLNNLGSHFNFQNVALAAFAQQQQQQHNHQAALLQLLQNPNANNLFNLPNLSSTNPTINYLNMMSSAANLNGKHWKNS